MRTRKPAAEVPIDPAVVRALLEEQHSDLSGLPLVALGEGWDNKLFRLGDELIVRMPRRSAAAALIEHEQRWLPRLASGLPMPVPAPLRVGRPGCGFPWAWSVVAWFPGDNALVAPPRDPALAAVALARFVRALHQPAPDDAPRNPWRGVPLAERTEMLLAHLRRLDSLVDRDAILALWERVLAASPWTGPALWIHGDLHPGNLLVSGGRVSAVIDFGDLAAGDPAVDLSVLWMLLPSSAWPTFVTAARGASDPIDDDTLMRARGWALALGVAYLVNSLDDRAMASLGQATIDRALKDHP